MVQFIVAKARRWKSTQGKGTRAKFMRKQEQAPIYTFLVEFLGTCLILPATMHDNTCEVLQPGKPWFLLEVNHVGWPPATPTSGLLPGEPGTAWPKSSGTILPTSHVEYSRGSEPNSQKPNKDLSWNKVFCCCCWATQACWVNLFLPTPSFTLRLFFAQTKWFYLKPNEVR